MYPVAAAPTASDPRQSSLPTLIRRQPWSDLEQPGYACMWNGFAFGKRLITDRPKNREKQVSNQDSREPHVHFRGDIEMVHNSLNYSPNRVLSLPKY